MDEGSYPEQDIRETATGSACAPTQPVTFRPAAGASVTLQHLDIGDSGGNCSTTSPDNVVVTGFKVTWGVSINGDATNIVIDRFDGGSFGIGGICEAPTNITIRNSDWGPCRPIPTGGDDCRNQFTSDPRSGQNRVSDESTNVLVENNVFHEFKIDDPTHWECVWVGGGTNVTFRGNVFRTCQTNAIALPDTELRGTWLFENNWFGWDRNYVTTTALKFGLNGGCPTGTVIVRFNSFAPARRSATRRAVRRAAASSSSGTSSRRRTTSSPPSASRAPCTAGTSSSTGSRSAPRTTLGGGC